MQEERVERLSEFTSYLVTSLCSQKVRIGRKTLFVDGMCYVASGRSRAYEILGCLFHGTFCRPQRTAVYFRLSALLSRRGVQQCEKRDREALTLFCSSWEPLLASSVNRRKIVSTCCVNSLTSSSLESARFERNSRRTRRRSSSSTNARFEQLERKDSEQRELRRDYV